MSGRFAFADHARRAPRLARGKSPLLSRIFWPLSGGCCGFVLTSERCGEVTTRVDVELAVGAAQVLLDRLRGDEKRLGDLLVAQPLGRHLCDAPLARGQLVDTAQEPCAWPRTGRRQLFVAPRRQRFRTALMGLLDPLAQQPSRLAAAVAATQGSAEVDQRPSVFEPCR